MTNTEAIKILESMLRRAFEPVGAEALRVAIKSLSKKEVNK